ncbi:NADPH oxidase activator 1 [Lingula anatina]|uniref:NADPH oxidase activator 1 n=1 Tax=Lingula anatina TaxID=7574 RepID=A0A1S3KDI1_LINAN|nr:NADPH oxidase activator 1 [Lingula anatina]|eukprot:XP_013420316.1 NADPH oxidase activator 1 [Lingula anatina]
MSLTKKEILTTWNKAVILYENGDINGSLRTFQEIPEPTAKILFNISQGLLSKGQREEAFQVLSQAVQKDSHMAVGYFQSGALNLSSNRFSDAEKDFLEALEKLRGKGTIDYKQLGLNYKLSTVEVYYNCAVCQSHLGHYEKAKWLLDQALQQQLTDKWTVVIQQALHNTQIRKPVPVSSSSQVPIGLLFKPPQSAIANLQKKDYLGKAKVVSCLEPEGESETSKVRAHPNLSRTSSHSAPNSPVSSRKNVSPRPARPPKGPHLVKDFKSGSSTCLSSSVKDSSDNIGIPPHRFLLPLGTTKSSSHTDVTKANNTSKISQDEDTKSYGANSTDTRISRPPVPLKIPPRLLQKSSDRNVASSLIDSHGKWTKESKGTYTKSVPAVAGRHAEQMNKVSPLQSLSGNGQLERNKDILELKLRAMSKDSNQKEKSPVPPKKPPSLISKSSIGVVMATFECDSETSTWPLRRGSTLQQALQKASQKFGYPENSISIWWRWSTVETPMYIENEASMAEVWTRLQGDSLHLQVYGKPSS